MGKFHQLDNLKVKSYIATKCLSPFQRQLGLHNISLADLGEVMCEPDTCFLTVVISDVVVVGVNDLQSRKACIKIAPTTRIIL